MIVCEWWREVCAQWRVCVGEGGVCVVEGVYDGGICVCGGRCVRSKEVCAWWRVCVWREVREDKGGTCVGEGGMSHGTSHSNTQQCTNLCDILSYLFSLPVLLWQKTDHSTSSGGEREQ